MNGNQSNQNGEYGRLDRVGRVRAPQLPSTTRLWLQGGPIDLAQLKGRPVLLDFWTSGCINCLHVAQELEALQQAFPELVVIGIHTPKFQRESDPDLVRSAIQRLGLRHPIFLDEDRKLRELYAIRAWPTLVLIDPAGRIVRQVAGEGRTPELNQMLREMRSSEGKAEADYAYLPALPKSENPFLAHPEKLTLDPKTQRLFVAETGAHRILIFTPAGELIQQLGAGRAGYLDGDDQAAKLYFPQGLAVDPSGRYLYLADRGNHALRRWDAELKTVETLLGDGKQGRGYLPGWRGQAAQLNAPWDLAWHQDWLYFACAGSHQIWRYHPQSGLAEVVLGRGEENLVEGSPAEALLAQPMALASDGQHLYWLDAEASALRRWDGTRVDTLIGTGLFAAGHQDGAFPHAQLQHPQGLAYRDGQLWIADTYNQAMRCYDLETGILSTVAKDLAEPQDLVWDQDQGWMIDQGIMEWT
ncbi:MAG: redoxin domain-containing protein, partial [Bacteroidota bacterium]